ncbi:MAG: hypothetical protein UW18_C0003G0153 [Microgenomates group bacterium GW2011_GWF1_44_10]|nr:MAG: hypothetical protein UW18_C0003G0153 [Microgenomates group bacterium GW2011_GWF1_44_10]
MQKMGSPNWKKLKNLLPYAILFLITLFFVRHFFTNALLDGDDAPHHSGRVAAYYLALKQGQFPVRWAHNFDNGLGSPLFVLMYHLPYATAAFLYAALPITIQFSIGAFYVQSFSIAHIFNASIGGRRADLFVFAVHTH